LGLLLLSACGDAAGGEATEDATLPVTRDAAVHDAASPSLDAALGSDAAAPEAGVDASAANRPDGGAGIPNRPDAAADANAMLPEAGPPRDGGAAVDASTDAVSPSTEAGSASDRCDVAKLDPSAPPRVLSLSGNLGTHDPALIEQDGTFYLFHTGARVPGKTSRDLMSWLGAPSALGGSNPAWVAREVPGATDLWAPDISFFNGQYHLYYSASTFGSNSSCIGHATRSSMANGSFADQGSVVCSNHGNKDDWNAIDPNLILDESGAPWLVFGSFWSGIKAVALKPDGSRKDQTVHALASRGGGAIEAPFVVRRCGYYYLFVSFDKCCDGANSTYNIRVGRSQQLLGPYVDKAGKALMDGGGTPVLASAGRYHGPGHNAVIFVEKRAYNVYHAYDANAGGNSVLRVAELAWDAEGWPVSGGP
jgi:arabinan endo-1,5-alpha-L-arabinosidase